MKLPTRLMSPRTASEAAFSIEFPPAPPSALAAGAAGVAGATAGVAASCGVCGLEGKLLDMSAALLIRRWGCACSAVRGPCITAGADGSE